DELLVQVEALAIGDEEAIRNNVTRKRANSQAKLAHYRRARDRLLDGDREEHYIIAGPRLGSYLTLRRGIVFEEENIAWCDFVLEAVGARGTRGCGASSASGHCGRSAEQLCPPGRWS